MKTRLFRALLTGVLLLLTAACNLPNSSPTVITVVVQPTSPPVASPSPDPGSGTEIIPQEATSTPLIPSTGDATAAPPPPTEQAGPQCTINQNVNLRRGPGRIYDPPVTSLLAGTVVIPTGFQKQGFPGGSWIQVTNPGNNTVGWVSAAPEFITCSIDMATLQVVDFPPTPRPAIPVLTNSQPQGSFDGFTFNLHFSGAYLMRIELYAGDGTKDGDHIQQVVFTISGPDGTVRQQVEDQAPYCVFGGTEGCANWPKANGKYIWGEGQPEVKDGGKYSVNIDADADDGTSANWNFDLTVDLP